MNSTTINQQAIGVFDSGVGGLSVLRVLQKQLPDERFVYLADSAYAPYGLLSEAVLQQRCQQIAAFFVKKNVKAIVIACNTATAVMAETLRQQLALPIVALEPAIKPASQQTRNGRIGVFATQNTLNSQRYQSLIKTYAVNQCVFQSPCLGFVEQVEKGELDTPKTQQLVYDNLHPMLSEGIDTLVLGCTHYPFLLSTIKTVSQQLHANDLRILDTATAVASRLSHVLHEQNLASTKSDRLGNNAHRYYSTANPADFKQVFSLLIQQPIRVLAVDDNEINR